MPQDAILDPQGKTGEKNIPKLGIEHISNVRIGKHITLEIEADNLDAASEKIDAACKKILCNQIMESYQFTLTKI